MQHLTLLNVIQLDSAHHCIQMHYKAFQPSKVDTVCEGALNLFIWIIIKSAKENWPQDWALGVTMGYRLQTDIIHDDPLGLAIQAVLHPTNSTYPMHTRSSQFLQENVVDGLKHFTKKKVNKRYSFIRTF